MFPNIKKLLVSGIKEESAVKLNFNGSRKLQKVRLNLGNFHTLRTKYYL